MTYEAAVKKLSKYTDERLLRLLLAEKRNPGWTKTRAVYITALKEALLSRDILPEVIYN